MDKGCVMDLERGALLLIAFAQLILAVIVFVYVRDARKQVLDAIEQSRNTTRRQDP